MTKAKIKNVKPLLQQANVSGWHFLPEMPEINKEVELAVVVVLVNLVITLQ